MGFLGKLFKRRKQSALADDIRRAQENETRYLQRGDLRALDEAIAVWERILRHPAFPQAEARFRVVIWNDAGLAYWHRYWARGQVADLDEALRLWREALALIPPDSPYRPTLLNNLGNGLSDRYARTGEPADLDEALHLHREALALTPPDSPDRPGYLNNLGNGLLDRYARTGAQADLDEALRLWREALALTPPDAPDRPALLSNLGTGLSDRYARTGEPADLDEALHLHREALALTPPDSPDRPSRLNSLGAGLHERYACTGDLADLDRAIRLWREALALTPPDAPDRPALLSNLGTGLSDRYARTGELADLDEALHLWREALELTPTDSPDRPALLNNLGTGLRDRYARTGDLADLDEALRLWREALDFTPTDSPDRPGLLNNLGLGLRARYARTGDLADLDEAIRLWREALELTPPDAPHRPMYLNNLGTGLRDRYAHSGQLKDLDEAIQSYRKALRLTPPNSPDRLARLNNLGVALSDRYDRSGQLEDLEDAIQAYREALRLTPFNSPSRPARLNNLGVGLRDRYAHNGQLKDLEEAIQSYREALRLILPNSPLYPMLLNNLGNSLRDRYAHSKQLKELEEAIQAYREACRLGLDVAPLETMRAGRNWARWSFRRQAWEEVEDAASYALEVMDRLVMVQITREAKENWLREFQEMPILGAYALAKQGKLRQAVETVEHGRAQLLREALERNRRDLAQLEALGHGNLLDRYRRASEERKAHLASLRQVAAGKVPGLTLQEARQALREAEAALEAVIAEIRRVPGYERFLLPPAFADIQAATQEAPLLYLLATPAGGLALIVAGKGSSRPPVTPVWMESLTEKTLRERMLGPDDDPELGGYLGAYFAWRENPHDRAATRAWFEALDEITRWLGEVLTPPLTPPLRGGGSGEGMGQGVLIPTGLLGLLPLHAAWREAEGRRRYALDDIAFTYAPSARALLEARQIARATQGERLFAVANPDGSLPYAEQEVEAVAAHFPQPFIAEKEKATLATVRYALPHHDLYHFACHGATHWGDPMKSALKLYGRGRFTVREALEMEGLQARLAFLSACETGIPGRKLPDEVIALPVGLQQAGVAGVVSTLWSVADESTAELVAKFYALWKGEGLSPAVALNAAQRWLRDEADGGRWSHPFYWAAFTLTGV